MRSITTSSVSRVVSLANKLRDVEEKRGKIIATMRLTVDRIASGEIDASPAVASPAVASPAVAKPTLKRSLSITARRRLSRMTKARWRIARARGRRTLA
jgi:hypothetical protein